MWSRLTLSGAMLLMLVVSPAGVGTSHAGVSCAPLKRLLDYTDSGFRQLRGYFDPRLKSWVATYRMVGASICTIEDIENIAIYSCKWTHDPQNSAVPEAYADMLQSVTRCLAISALARAGSALDESA